MKLALLIIIANQLKNPWYKQGKHTARKPPKLIILQYVKQANKLQDAQTEKLTSWEAHKLTNWQANILTGFQTDKRTEWQDVNMTIW